MNEEFIKGKKKTTFQKLKPCMIKSCIICLLFFGLGFFVISFFVPTIVSNFINDQIPGQVVMQESNSDLWAKLPGKSNVDLYRKITLYEPKNLIDVIFRGSKPEFIEHQNVYSLIQHQELLDRQYLDNKVTVNRYTTFMEAEPGKEEKQYKIINPGLFGGWYLGKSAPPAKLSWMTVGQVLQNLKDQLPLNVMYLGFEHNFVKDEASAMALLKGEQDETKRKQMYYDELMGIGSANTMENWIKMSLEGSEFGVAGQALKDYFDISQETLSSLYKTLQQPVGGLNASAFPYYKCNPYGQDPAQKKFKYDCTGKYLTALQWQSLDITGNPPPGMGIEPTDSVSFTNNTLHDFIEIAYFYKSKFKDNVADYGDMKFDLDWAYDFLDREYDYPTKEQLKDPHILQHKGNIEYLYNQGEIFDKSKDLKDLQGVMDRFKLDSLEKAHVVYKWLDQMGRDFAYRENMKGNVEYGVLGIFGSESIFYNFRNLTEYLLPNIIANYVMNNQKWKDCPQFLTDSIDDITEEHIKSICSDNLFKIISEQTIIKIQELCIYDGYGPLLTEFQNKHKLSDLQKLQICSDQGTTDSSFQTHLLNAHNQLKIQYQCTYDRCSKMELAIRQWARSEITQNPLQGTNLKQTYSVSDWNDKIFPLPFEYGYFAHEFADIFPQDKPPQILTDLETKLLLHFRGIFNPLAITTAFIFSLNQPLYYDEFVNRYQFKYYDHLLYYIRFAAINGMLGGAIIHKTPKELFFGYTEHLGEDLKTRDPAGGGDPGINSWVRMGDPNMTLEDATLFPLRINTGADNITKTRTFVDINQYQHAMYNYTYYDGNTTTTVWDNPWNIPEKFDKATDGVIFPPYRNTEDPIQFYVPQVYRTIKFLPSSGPNLFGLDTIHYEVDMSDWDKSKDYNNFWSGTINMEKPFSAPATVSLPHFYKADKSLQDSVVFYNEDNQIIQANDYDKIYANIEKFSGAPLQAVIQLMISMRVEKDALFPKCNEMALPLLILYNSGNFTDSSASDQFGELKMGLAVQNWGWYIVMGLGIFLICISVLIVVKTYPILKKNREQVLIDN